MGRLLLRPLLLTTSCIALVIAPACERTGDGNGDGDGDAIFGDGDHSLDSVVLSAIADSGDSLDIPRDLAFHPDRPDELWVVNRGSESTTILFDANTAMTDAEQFIGGGGNTHFMAQPSALAFSEDNGNMATIHETDELTQGPGGTPEDFMGPTLWSTDLNIFDSGHGGHLDMLHNSPNGMGIAWEEDNAFWVFDGYHDAITRYDFHEDHGPGGADHSDGEVHRYVEGEVRRDSNVPSHMELDHDTGLLYIADTGNERIAVLDTTTGEEGADLPRNFDGTQVQREWLDADITTLVDGADVNMGAPSGLALRDGVIYVTDNSSGVLFAFSMEDGAMLDWIDLERDSGGLMGIAFDDMGRLYLADAEAEEVLRLETRDE